MDRYPQARAGGPMTELATNVLSCGDNLDILRRYLPDADVNLISLDPPFNSNRDAALPPWRSAVKDLPAVPATGGCPARRARRRGGPSCPK